MQCAHCHTGIMRLVRFENRQEVFACYSCNTETLLLDCHLCERRAVRQLPDSEHHIARWACHRCRITKHKCPSCNKGWVVPAALTNSQQPGYCCEHCQQHWADEAQIGA